MKINSKTKLLGGILSAIVLGAVGSGIWQYVFDPALSQGTKVILDLATLGAESFKNGLYQEIALGFHEKASSALYAQTNLLFGLTLILLPVALVLKTKELIQRKSAMLDELQRLENGIERKTRSIEDLQKDIQNSKLKRLLVVIYVLLVAGAVLFSAQFVTSKRDRYVNSAIAHYIQLKRIVSPFITQNELLLLDSRFSQIQSANDYESIIFQMRDMAKQHNAKVPDFEIWK